MSEINRSSGWRILIADDDELTRRGTRRLLESRRKTEAWEVENGKEAVEKAQVLRPDLAILNSSLPILDGFGAAREIQKCAPETRILILSLVRTDALTEALRKIAVTGYLRKSESAELFLRRVDAALQNVRESESEQMLPEFLKRVLASF